VLWHTNICILISVGSAHTLQVSCSIGSSHPVHDERMKTWDSSVCATSYLVARMIRE
jgi:Cys-tRNA synthase (O-phospho-L-seryl-tRNA:Cys-tRNA synthase)